MRRSGGMRVLALVLALTVFFTSGFFVLFGDKVFGARNTTTPMSETNPYVNEGEATSTTVGVRNTTESGNILLTDEGSNVQGKIPVSRQRAWSPALALDELLSAGKITQAEYDELKVNVDSLGDGFMVPGTDDNNDSNGVDKKGSEGNPFLLLEVVPDKAMQELTYFSGNEESGLPFDQGGMSATMMEQIRTNNSDKVYRFVNRADLVDDVIKNIKTPIENLYGNWTVEAQYEVFNIGKNDTDNQFSTSQINLFSLEPGTSTTEKQGYYDVNEIYNFDVTTDDLLDKDPVKKDVEYDYYGDIKSITYNENEPSDYALCVAAGIPGASTIMTNEALLDNFKQYLYNNIHLDNRLIKSDKRSADSKGAIVHNTAFVKYNLTQPFLHANYIYPIDFLRPGEVPDVAPSGDTAISYDVAWSRLGRSGVTAHKDTYWRILFRKYYVDHFEELYDKFNSANMKWRLKWKYNGNIDINSSDSDQVKIEKKNIKEWMKEYLYDDIQALIAERSHPGWTMPYSSAYEECKNKLVNSINENQELTERDTYIEKILSEYRPIFEDKGYNIAAIRDYMDWDSSVSDTLSEARTYQAEPQGGYILAVKPGMGDMYLVTDKKKIIEMGGSENDIVFARDKKAPKFSTPVANYSNGNDKTPYMSGGELIEPGDPEMRWIYVPTYFALNGGHPSGVVNSDMYFPGYLDDSRYTYGYASKSVRNLNDMWYAIYDRYNRRYHGGSDFDTISKKMLIDTTVSDKVWTPDDAGEDDPNQMYFTYSNNGKNQNHRTDAYHLNVLKQILGINTLPASRTISNRIRGYNNTRWTNIFTGTLGGLLEGENNADIKIDNILKNNNNLIDSNGYSWFNFSVNNGTVNYRSLSQAAKPATETEEAQMSVPWLYAEYNGEKIAASKYITGLCFNFYDFRYSGGGPTPSIGRYPDIYSRDMLNGFTYHLYDYEMKNSTTYPTPYDKDSRFMQLCHKFAWTALDKSPTEQYVDHNLDRSINTNARNIEKARFKDGDEAVLVDRGQVVTEKIKKYHFTYYGFGANDILKRSLFNFTGATGEQKFKDFHYRVLCVTPAEMNAISTIAKKINSSVSSETGKILFDLSERADMFYIHTLKTRKIIGQDDMTKAFKFYSDIVKGDNTTRTIEGMNSFFENDLEWDQVMKIIKRSSNSRYGSNLPIIFNGLVARMSVENADPVKPEDAKTESEAKDTAMYLYDQDPSKIWNGNLNNISKLYLILIQFDLQAVKGSVINKNEDRSKWVRIERTFMKDIFPYLKQAPISGTYDSGVSDNMLKRVPGSAKYTGYVQDADTPTENSWGRKLASSAKIDGQSVGEQFLRNALSLWNMYTFYPYGKKLENRAIDYISQGYLASYCTPRNGDTQDVFNVPGAYRYRTGSDGMDGQNVYVYKVGNDPAGEHADSLISSMGHNGLDTNTFLSIAYNIMHNGGEPEDIEIQVMPRNQKYTTFGLDSGNPPHSNVMLDYYKDTSMYDPADLEELRGQEKNLKIKALNPNNEIAVITEIDVFKNNTFVSGSFIPRSSFVSDGAGEYLEPIRYFGEPSDGEKSLKDILKKNNLDTFGETLGQELCEVTGNSQNYRGIKVESGDELIFHIPYLLRDYFDGYDRIRVKGKYWVRVRKKQDGLMVDNIEIRDFEHIININEMDMFMLE